MANIFVEIYNGLCNGASDIVLLRVLMLSFVHSFRNWVTFNGGNSNVQEFLWIKVFDLMSTNVNKPHFVIRGLC